MKHLLMYESFSPSNLLEEGSIPVYDEDQAAKDPMALPEMSVKTTQIVETVENLLERKADGEIQNVIVLADIPTQGKNAPQYIRDEMELERQRLAKRKRAIHGSRIERADRPEDEDYTDEINIFVDSEFIVEGVEKNDPIGLVLAIPRSFIRKIEMDKSLKEKYTIKLSPRQIFEISYTLVK
jgi:hypothetical protein